MLFTREAFLANCTMMHYIMVVIYSLLLKSIFYKSRKFCGYRQLTRKHFPVNVLFKKILLEILLKTWNPPSKLHAHMLQHQCIFLEFSVIIRRFCYCISHYNECGCVYMTLTVTNAMSNTSEICTLLQKSFPDNVLFKKSLQEYF